MTASKKNYIRVIFAGLLAGLLLVGMTWAQEWWLPEIPYTAFFVAFWVSVMAVVGFGLYLRKKYPILSRLAVFAAVTVAVGLVYLLPHLFAPGSCGDGMPRAFAGCTTTCVDVCTWWVELGDPLPGGGTCKKTNPWDLGCCLAYKQVCTEECEEDDDPPSVSGSVTCGTAGSNGWCRAGGQLSMNASDPQGYTVTINGAIAGVNFTCPAGTSCTRGLPEGSGNIQFRSTASTSGLSSAWVNTTFKYDSVAPTASVVNAGTLGANGWYISTVTSSGSGADVTSGLASAQVSLDAATYGPSLSLGDGTYTVHVRATDLAGNVTTSSTNVRVDTTPPSLSLSIPGPFSYQAGYYSSNVTITAAASDSVSGIASTQYSINGGAWQNGSSVTLSSDGEFTVTFRSTNYAGLITTDSRTVKIDDTAPVVDFIKLPENTSHFPLTWFKTPVSIGLDVTDAYSGVGVVNWYANNPPYTVWSPAASQTFSTDGVHTLMVQAQDVAGNNLVTGTSVRVDQTPPLQSLAVSSGTMGDGGYYVSNVTLSATSSDATSGVQLVRYRINGGAWLPGTSATLTADGTRTVQFQTVDNAGNETLGEMVIKIDKTPPTATIANTGGTLGDNGWYKTPATFSINASDATSLIKSVEYNLDSQGWVSGDTVTISGDGVHALAVRVTDNAGNVFNTSTTVQVDKTAPLLSAAQNGTSGLNSWYVSAVDLSASASDPTSGVRTTEHRVNGGSWQPGASVTVSADGNHTVDFRTTDNAGNQTIVSRAFKIDQANPLINIDRSGTLGSNNWYTTALALSLPAQDDTSGIGQVEYRVNAGSWIAGSSLTLSDGVYTVEARATDNAGNQTIVSASLKVDTQLPKAAPVITATAGNSGWYLSAAALTANPADDTSGVATVEYRVNEGPWAAGEDVLLENDGAHTVDFRVTDHAGLQAIISQVVKIDQTKPQSVFTTPLEGSSGTVIKGVYKFIGSSLDATSGIGVVEISFNGSPWQSVPQGASSPWTYSWNSSNYPNGTYVVLVRAKDVAGNIENTARVTVIVANNPPGVKIQDMWWIWESGSLSVSDNVIPIGEIIIRIACSPLDDVVMRFDDPADIPDNLRWDRRCGDGNLAESGDYTVTLTACDIFGNCASASGEIRIPFIVPPQPTWTPTPTLSPTATESPEVERRATATPSPTPTIPMAVITPTPEPEPEVLKKPFSIFPWFVLLFGLIAAGVWSSTSLGDPRPPALKRLAENLSRLSNLREKSQQ